jgi:hypothetical protein
LLRKAIRTDPDINKNGSSPIFGKMLGYPECCVEFPHDIYVKNYTKYFPSKKIAFYFNNFLSTNSNFYLSTHRPCSYSCKKTISYNKEILKIIAEYYPKYASDIIKFTKKPLVLWFNTDVTFPQMIDLREGFIFNGILKKEGINYRSFRYLKSPDLNKSLIKFKFYNKISNTNFIGKDEIRERGGIIFDFI